MPTNAEDLVTTLKNTRNASDLIGQLVVIVGGIADIVARLQHQERANLELSSRLSASEIKLTEAETKVAAIETDRSAYARRVDDVEKLPTDTAKKVEAMEARLRAVEGACGSYGMTVQEAGKPDLAKVAVASKAEKDKTFSEKVGLSSPKVADPIV